MNCEEIMEELKSMASEKYKANVVKLGIPEAASMGVSTGDVRKLAKKAGKSNELAEELWATGYHEARLLAVLIYDYKSISLNEAGQLMEDVVSWDLCDHLCNNLIVKLKNYDILIEKWCSSERTYYKRAAFSLMASAIVHKKEVTGEIVDEYLNVIATHADDQRDHVKKAVSWALREIGKRDFECNEKAIILAHELVASENKAKVWIGKDALKELENLVKVEGRSRLISASSKMGKQQ